MKKQCRVKEIYKGSPNKVVIHIQDAHNNYEAQTNIANIIDLLVEQYGLTVAGIEGSSGKILTDLYATFPDDDARYSATDFFVRENQSVNQNRNSQSITSHDQRYFRDLLQF